MFYFSTNLQNTKKLQPSWEVNKQKYETTFFGNSPSVVVAIIESVMEYKCILLHSFASQLCQFIFYWKWRIFNMDTFHSLWRIFERGNWVKNKETYMSNRAGVQDPHVNSVLCCDCVGKVLFLLTHTNKQIHHSLGVEISHGQSD